MKKNPGINNVITEIKLVAIITLPEKKIVNKIFVHTNSFNVIQICQRHYIKGQMDMYLQRFSSIMCSTHLIATIRFNSTMIRYTF